MITPTTTTATAVTIAIDHLGIGAAPHRSPLYTAFARKKHTRDSSQIREVAQISTALGMDLTRNSKRLFNLVGRRWLQ